MPRINSKDQFLQCQTMIKRNTKIRNYTKDDESNLMNYANKFLENDLTSFMSPSEELEALKTDLMEDLRSFLIPSKDTYRIIVEDTDSGEFLGFACFQKDVPYLILNFVIPNPNIKIGNDGLNWLKKALSSAFKRFNTSELLIRFYDENQSFLRFLSSKIKLRKISTKNTKLIQLDGFEISKL